VPRSEIGLQKSTPESCGEVQRFLSQHRHCIPCNPAGSTPCGLLLRDVVAGEGLEVDSVYVLPMHAIKPIRY